MKPQTLIMLVVAVGCGLAAMVMTQRFLTAPTEEKPKGKEVVVAAVDIQPGDQLNDTLIKTVEWPDDVLPEDAVTDPQEILGRSVRYPIAANEVVTPAKLAAQGVGPGLEPIIEEGKRAMSVAIKTQESAAGFIKPGSRVDIVMISKRSGTKGGKAKTILQNVQVIAVNQAINNEATDEQQGHVVEMITFMLTPEEAEMLALAQNTGAIQLVLRNPVEDDFVKTKGVTQDELERGTARHSEEKAEPAEGVKVAGDPGALGNFLDKLLGDKGEPTTKEPLSAPPIEITQVPPPPVQKKKRLVYRDIQGNVLMEVLLDADDKLVGSLDGLLEDVDPDELIGSSRSALATPSAEMVQPEAIPAPAVPPEDEQGPTADEAL
jgi:pilus assembly protein CpaB